MRRTRTQIPCSYEDAEVFVRERAGDGEVVGVHAFTLHTASDIGGPTLKHRGKTCLPGRRNTGGAANVFRLPAIV